ncbi:MAG: multidrug ABC transporter ATP-binding protein [Deltaproteobacteria bacterium]|nr:MAG: multidrug ABC transporter ATP-binding protein [Deltaproteobacteria bacterium]
MRNKIVLQWENVSFSVRHGFLMKNKAILRDINLSISKGSVLGLVGPNGAGKTTTIKLGAGLLAPDCGRVLINGRDATEKIARTSLGLLTETQYVYPHMRLKEWLIMLAGLSGIKRRISSQRADEMLEKVELVRQKNQMMRTLSKGQLQRAGLAQALLHDPDILLLDEPMSGLDPFWRFRIQKIILDLKAAGKTVLFSSHILSDVERLCDCIALIENGKLRWSGRLSEINREIKGYEVVARTGHAGILQNLADKGTMDLLQDGCWLLTIDQEKKESVLRLAAEKKIVIESLLPVRQELEAFLFDSAPD